MRKIEDNVIMKPDETVEHRWLPPTNHEFHELDQKNDWNFFFLLLSAIPTTLYKIL